MIIRSLLAVVALGALTAGCGVNKQYVDEQVAQSEARSKAAVATLRDGVDSNTAEIAKLRALSQQLSDKADMALNQAKGFENYQIIWQGEITFEFDSYSVTAIGEETLNEAGQQLETHPGALIEIAGHTDRTGDPKYNLMLGQQRAAAAKRYLAERFGVSLYRMFEISYGEQKPVAMPDERNGASRNRRVSLTIWGEMSGAN